MAREHRKEANKRKQKGASSGRSSGDGGADGEGTASGLAGDVVVENEDELPPKALLHRCAPCACDHSSQKWASVIGMHAMLCCLMCKRHWHAGCITLWDISIAATRKRMLVTEGCTSPAILHLQYTLKAHD